MTLIWDGLGVEIPGDMQPVVLDRRFIRLAGQPTPAPAPEPPGVLDIRFGQATSSFDPVRDGRRILKAAGLKGQGLVPAALDRSQDGADGFWANADHDPSLFVRHYRTNRNIVAALFSPRPNFEQVHTLFETLTWTPPDAWRRWRCFDLTFETPPNALLARARFQPGAFRIGFTLGRSRLVFERLAPAEVLLAGKTLSSWLMSRLDREHGLRPTLTAAGPDDVSFSTHPANNRFFSWLPWRPELLCGQARRDHNKILILTVHGQALPAADFQRTVQSHATATLQN